MVPTRVALQQKGYNSHCSNCPSPLIASPCCPKLPCNFVVANQPHLGSTKTIQTCLPSLKPIWLLIMPGGDDGYANVHVFQQNWAAAVSYGLLPLTVNTTAATESNQVDSSHHLLCDNYFTAHSNLFHCSFMSSNNWYSGGFLTVACDHVIKFHKQLKTDVSPIPSKRPQCLCRLHRRPFKHLSSPRIK